MLGFNIPTIDIDIPEFLDPALAYLEDNLPSPIYSVLLNVLSHFLALLTSLFTLLTSLLSTNPSTWDAQKILPPLISLFAAYLALLSLYRTTTWMVRTIIFFMKWGVLLGVFMGLLGWVLGNSNNNGLGNHGIVSTLGGLLFDIINGEGQNAAARPRSNLRAQNTRSRTKTTTKKKPKPRPWEPFERHHEWQQQAQNPIEAAADAQKFINDIVDTAGRKVKESGWWGIASKMINMGSRNTETDGTDDPAQKPMKGKTRSR